MSSASERLLVPLLALAAAAACADAPGDADAAAASVAVVDWSGGEYEEPSAFGDARELPDSVRALRLCGDPNNLPYSNARLEGFENELAAILAGEMDRDTAWAWQPQRRGFIRNTLRAGRCDVVMGVPSSFELALVTRPYYRSTYVFVTRADRDLDIRHLDDPRLRRLRVGVPVVGDDYSSTPGAEALARRGIIDNVVGYTVFGDYSRPNPPVDLIRAVAAGEVDVAIAWGPLAGWAATREEVPLRITPVSPQIDPPFTPFVFDISMAVRRGDDSLRLELERALERRAPEVRALLERYGVPLVETSGERARRTQPRARPNIPDTGR